MSYKTQYYYVCDALQSLYSTVSMYEKREYKKFYLRVYSDTKSNDFIDGQLSDKTSSLFF